MSMDFFLEFKLGAMVEYNTTASPLVSVFMPTYNHEHLLAASIESVLDQDFDDYELVIGDDASTDGTYQVAAQYQQRYPDKIKLFRNEKNLGITGNCNAILSHCSGKYIAFFSGDDIYLPGKLRKQVEMMEAHPDCILCYHDIEVFRSETGETIRYWNHGDHSSPPVTGASKEVAESLVLKGTGFMAALSVMVRRDCVPKSGFNPRIPIASDWLMWIDICAMSEGCVMFIDEVLARYRKHVGSITESNMNYLLEILITITIVEENYQFLRSSAYYSYLDLLIKQAGWFHMREEYTKAKGSIVKCYLELWKSWRWVGDNFGLLLKMTFHCYFPKCGSALRDMKAKWHDNL